MSQATEDAEEVIAFFHKIQELPLPMEMLVGMTQTYTGYVLGARAAAVASQQAVMLNTLIEQNERLVQAQEKIVAAHDSD